MTEDRSYGIRKCGWLEELDDCWLGMMCILMMGGIDLLILVKFGRCGWATDACNGCCCGGGGVSQSATLTSAVDHEERRGVLQLAYVIAITPR